MSNEYVYVAIDETGNLGESLKGGRYYKLVACVVNDRKRFENATRKLELSEKAKFNTHKNLRKKKLNHAIPAVSVTNDKICDIFENSKNRTSVVECVVVHSVDSYGLQTNDFFVGAVGYLISHSNKRYVELFGDKLQRTYIHSKNVEKQGEPAFVVWRSTGHPDISHRTEKPLGIDTGLMCLLHPSKKLGSPMVRLKDSSHTSYRDNT